MEKNEEKKKEENAKTKTTVAKTGKRKVSKTWEAMQRLKGSLIVNDPKFLLLMRYLIDTNIFVYMASDPEYLNRDIDAIIQEPETLLYISAESVRELIVAYRNKGLCSKRWKSAEAMIVAIEKEFYVKILPLKKEHMQTYAHMEINEAQGHKDPSDHVIIAHAITEHLPLISSDTRFGFYRSQGLDLVFNQK